MTLCIIIGAKWAKKYVPINVAQTVIKDDILVKKLVLNPSFNILGGAWINYY